MKSADEMLFVCTYILLALCGFAVKYVTTWVWVEGHGGGAGGLFLLIFSL
jgi:hypothetical protein